MGVLADYGRAEGQRTVRVSAYPGLPSLPIRVRPLTPVPEDTWARGRSLRRPERQSGLRARPRACWVTGNAWQALGKPKGRPGSRSHFPVVQSSAVRSTHPGHRQVAFDRSPRSLRTRGLPGVRINFSPARPRTCWAGCPRVLRERGKRLYPNEAASRFKGTPMDDQSEGSPRGT